MLFNVRVKFNYATMCNLVDRNQRDRRATKITFFITIVCSTTILTCGEINLCELFSFSVTQMVDAFSILVRLC